MPPTQSINPIGSPLFYPSSSLESGSLLQQHQQRPHHHDDLGSWTSALSSQAHSSKISSPGAGWVNVHVDPIIEGEASWQEEAHWMSFHNAVQSLVISFHQNNSNNCSSTTPASSRRQALNDSSKGSQRNVSPGNSSGNDDSSLAQSITRQVIREAQQQHQGAAAAPMDAIQVGVIISTEEASARTRCALAQAEQDELEIVGQGL